MSSVYPRLALNLFTSAFVFYSCGLFLLYELPFLLFPSFLSFFLSPFLLPLPFTSHTLSLPLFSLSLRTIRIVAKDQVNFNLLIPFEKESESGLKREERERE